MPMMMLQNLLNLLQSVSRPRLGTDLIANFFFPQFPHCKSRKRLHINCTYNHSTHSFYSAVAIFVFQFHNFPRIDVHVQVASHVLMGLTKSAPVAPTIFSPLGKACVRMDLTAVHDILLKTGYKDEEGAENEVN